MRMRERMTNTHGKLRSLFFYRIRALFVRLFPPHNELEERRLIQDRPSSAYSATYLSRKKRRTGRTNTMATTPRPYQTYTRSSHTREVSCSAWKPFSLPLTQAVIINIADNLACLQTAIRDGEVPSMSEIVRNFRRFDTDLRGWASPSSEEEYTWDPAIDTIKDPDAVWQGVYHVYDNHYICEYPDRSIFPYGYH